MMIRTLIVGNTVLPHKKKVLTYWVTTLTAWGCRTVLKVLRPFWPQHTEAQFWSTLPTAGPLRLKTIAAIDRAVAGRLKRNFRRLSAGGAGSGEHLAWAGGITPATATAAATAAASTGTETAAATTAGISLLRLAGVAAGFATFGFIGVSTFGEALLLLRGEREFCAAINAGDGFVLIRHTCAPWY